MKASSRYLAEGLGTFCLVFAGTGAIIVNDLTGGTITHVGIALTFGLTVMGMIYALGDISGAHLNPAVTIGFLAARRTSGVEAAFYCASQFAGATLASFLLRSIFPDHEGLGATVPALGVVPALVFELVMTFILMFVIINVASGSKEKGLMAGIAIGGTVALDALFGGPVSGASMNPARSFGPAAATMNFQSLWIYFAAPISGALLAIACWKITERRDPRVQ